MTKKPVSWNYTHLWQRGKHLDFDFFDVQTNDYQTCPSTIWSRDAELESVSRRQGESLGDFRNISLFLHEDVRVKRLDIALDELYKGYGHEDEQIKSPNWLINSIPKRLS